MGTRLALRIQERFEDLTRSEQKLAQFLLDRPDEILGTSATELAGFAGVSKATAARLFRNLGYSDFNDVRLQAREERNRTGPVQQIPMPQVSATLLARVRPGVHLISENASIWPEELASTGPNDALVIIAVRPWPQHISTMLNFAKTTRLKSIVITDPTNVGKAQRKGALVLNCHVSTPWSELTQTSVLSMAQLLASALINRLGQKADTRRNLIANLAEEFEDDRDR